MRIHRRQFVIGSQQILPNKNWQASRLTDEIWLSYCQDLEVSQSTDSSDRQWHILGFAVETFSQKSSPELEIPKTETERVPQLSQTWTGRWILIGNQKLYLDASGLLGCFYGRDSEGKIWASSSPALLAQIIFSDRPPAVDSRQLGYENGISWYVPPRSRFIGISRLLPSQSIDLGSGDIQSHPLMPDILPDRDYLETIAEIQQIFITTLQRLARLTPDLWLGLTAGYDSRSILALSYAADIPVRPFTRIAARTSVADLALPPQLSRECNYDHIFIRSPQRYPERRKLAEEHTAAHVSAGDAEPFVKGVRDCLKGISIGGHGYGVAKNFAGLSALPEDLENAELGASAIAQMFQAPSSSATAGLKEWLDWILSHPQPNLNWRGRFYLEQRHAGWQSSKEQLYDLNDLCRFPILNSAYLYSLFLSIKPEQRLDSQIQQDLINNTAPQLNSYPFNPQDSYFSPSQIVTYKGKHLPEYLFGNFAKRVRWKLNSLMLK